MIERFRHLYARGLDGCLAVLILTVTLIALAQVTLRYGFSGALAWAEEVSVILMVWFTAFGAARAWLSDLHVNVPLLPDALGPRARLWLWRLFDVAAIAAGLALAQASRPLLDVYASLMLDTIDDVSVWWQYAPLPVGGIALALAGLVMFVSRRA